MPARRNLPDNDAIVEAVAADILQTGLLHWTLRGCGDRIDVSARMLAHHFGNRENLLRAGCDRIHEIHRDLWFGPEPVTGFDRLVDDDLLPAIRFGSDLAALAVAEGGLYAELYETTMADWRQRLEAALVDGGSPDPRRRAELAVIAIRGVHVHFGVTRDLATARRLLLDLQALVVGPGD
ncbi:MAG: hypothetical protein AAGE98_08240 [Actinomycetota bacterium]